MISPITNGTPQVNKLQAAKLHKGAQDFEAMMLQQIWKGMRFDESDSGPGQALTDLSLQAMSTGLAAKGGLGIAKMMERSLK